MTDEKYIDWAVMGPIYQAEAHALRSAKIAGNFADTGEKIAGNTDRTNSTLQLVEQIERLSKKLRIAQAALGAIARNGDQVAITAFEMINKEQSE